MRVVFKIRKFLSYSVPNTEFTINVTPFPASESASSFVNFESRYGM